VFPAPGWGDIIPSFPYTNSSRGTSIYPGMNTTDDGLDILMAGCEVIFLPIEPPTTTTTAPARPTTSPPTTVPVPPTTAAGTTTTLPGVTTTTPGTTTTTTPPTTSPPTTAPPSELPSQPVDPPGGAETTPPLDGAVVDPGDEVEDLGPLTPSERDQLEGELDPESGLAGTGHDDTELVAIGLVVFLAGIGLTALAGWRRRTST
jgi:hypothetical protein